MDVLSRGQLARFAAAVEALPRRLVANDPFRIGRENAGMIVYDEDSDEHDEIHARVGRALTGRDPETRVRLIRSLAGSGRRLLALDAAMMAHEGVDPLAILAGWDHLRRAGDTELHLDRMRGGTGSDFLIVIHDDDRPDDAPPEIMLEMGEGDRAHGRAQWLGDAVSVEGIPDTVAAVLQGRPLSDVLSHPVLDRHALTIAAVVDQGAGRRLLKLVVPTDTWGVDDLVGILPILRD